MKNTDKTYSSEIYNFILIDHEYISFSSLLSIADVRVIDITLDINLNSKTNIINSLSHITFSNIAYGEDFEEFVDKSYVIRLSDNANNQVVSKIKEKELELGWVSDTKAALKLHTEYDMELVNYIFGLFNFYRAKDLETDNWYYDITLIGFLSCDIISLNEMEKSIIPILKNNFELENDRLAKEEEHMDDARAEEIKDYYNYRELNMESDSWMDEPENYWNID